MLWNRNSDTGEFFFELHTVRWNNNHVIRRPLRRIAFEFISSSGCFMPALSSYYSLNTIYSLLHMDYSMGLIGHLCGRGSPCNSLYYKCGTQPLEQINQITTKKRSRLMISTAMMQTHYLPYTWKL